jgi:phosphatidylglycerophosphate synthase
MVGLIGAALFALGPAHDALAASLVWTHSVLDGCDGELARVGFQESDFGATIDFWGDNLVHLALFGALAFGYARAGHAAAPLLGLAAALGIAGSAALAFRRKRLERQAAAEPGGRLLRRLCDFLAQRDFIYLLLAMAFLGKTYAFLWAGAVGAPLFFIIMLAAGQAGDSLPGAAGRAEAA